MEQVLFNSLVLSREVNINKIANKFNIYKKYKWEEPLVLRNKDLQSILGANVENKHVYLFSFGSCIFINFSREEMNIFVDYILDVEPKINMKYVRSFIDEFYLKVLPESTLHIQDDEIIVPEIKDYYFTIISTVLAKSISLERVEDSIYRIFDKFEPTLDSLEHGNFNFKDKTLAKNAADILRFKYETISYIMIDEIPDIAWENTEIEKFYRDLNNFFDLNDRYESIMHKIDILMSVLSQVTTLVHAYRSTLLEWLIIILIAIEIILTFF